MGELLKPAARCTQAKPELGDFLLVQNTEPSNGTVAGVGWSERGHLQWLKTGLKTTSVLFV